MQNAEQSVLAGNFFKQLGPQDRLLVSHDLEETTSFLHRNAVPFRYELQDRKNPFAAKLEFKQLHDMTLSHGRFDPAIVVSLSPSEPFYALYCRLNGGSEYTVGKQVFITSPAVGALLDGIKPLRVRTRDHWHVFGTNFSRTALERELSNLLGREITGRIEFDPAVNFAQGSGRLVKRMCSRLYLDVAKAGLEIPLTGIRIRQQEKSVLSAILEGLHHNYSRLVHEAGKNIAPRQVRNVEEFIREYADEPISLGDLAVVGGVSARSLQYTFLHHRGCSPMAFLRQIRFERVRAELLRAEPGATVTEAALRWGFAHPGRFAAEYRERFQESPSETLRRVLGSLGEGALLLNPQP